MAQRPAGLLLRSGVSLALVLFAALAAASGLDRLSPASPTLARLVPPPLRAQAAQANATVAISGGNAALALANARRAVAADPVEPQSTALLGTAHLMSGNEAEAEAAFRVAARFGWRQPMTQLYWYEAAIQAGDMARAVDRADALLRVRPTMPGRELVLAPVESDPAGRAALVRRLADNPGWLHGYLNPDPTVDEGAFKRRSVVLIELAAAGTRLGCKPVAPFVTAALARGARRESEAVWTGHCPGASIASGLADGGFEQFGGDEDSPFGWRAQLTGDSGLREIEQGPGDRAVRLRNSATVSRMVLRQPIALEPGTYRLSGKTSPGRIAASLGCGGPPRLPSLVDGDLAGGGQVLQVPACTQLELGLWLRPGGGEVELDDLVLRKVG